MPDASWFTTPQYMMDGGLLLGGIAVPEEFEVRDYLSFMGCSSARSTRFALWVEVLHDAGASCGGGLCGSISLVRESPLYGELDGCLVHRQGGRHTCPGGIPNWVPARSANGGRLVNRCHAAR